VGLNPLSLLKRVKKKNILGMALQAWHVFFGMGGGRWAGAAAILHNALMGRLWLRGPLQVWQKGSLVRQYHKVHYVNIASETKAS